MRTGFFGQHRRGAEPAASETGNWHDLPPGFDVGEYLRLNPDVAAAVGSFEEAEQHYRDYGARELRAFLPDGRGIDDPDSRLLQEPATRGTWREQLIRLAASSDLEAILREHPRAAWLQTGFNLASYLVDRQDVASAVEDPLAAAFHFLEIGLEEGVYGRPRQWDPKFVSERYDFQPPDRLEAIQVLAALRAAGVSPFQIALTEAEYWALQGYCGPVLSQIFDHGYYHAAAARMGRPPEVTARLSCIDHFCAVGVSELIPIRHDLVFDPGFYCEQCDQDELDRMHVVRSAECKRGDSDDPATHGASTCVALYSDWLGNGLRKYRSPNLQSWAKGEFGISVPQELRPLLSVYRLNAGDLSADTPTLEVLRHLVSRPQPGVASLDLSDPALTEFFVQLADLKASKGEESVAEWLYWRVLRAAPAHDRAARHLADLLQRRGRLEVAQVLREQCSGEANHAWNTLNLAAICLEHGDVSGAANLVNSLPSGAFRDVAIRDKWKELGRKAFDRVWSGLADYMAAYGVSATQEHLRETLTACTPRFSTAVRSHPVRSVALIGNDDLYQCKLYRVDQKVEQLREAGYSVRAFSPTRELDAFLAQVNRFDAAIFFRVPAFPPIIDAIVEASQHGLLTFYEIDDLVFDPDIFPPPFETYAGQIDRIDYDAMACGVPLFEHAMKLCEYGIASTRTIQEMMKTRVRSGQVFEHRNALGRLHSLAMRRAIKDALPQPEHRPLILLYASGTRAHKNDFHDILEPALARFLSKKRKNVEIRLIGYFGHFRYLDPEKDPVKIMEPVWDFEEYCSLVAEADINLSVLSRSPVTDAKSEIKWMEAAMFGIPSVVSDTAGNREAIVHGETGFLCAGRDEFVHALELLVEDPELRERIGGAARERVLNAYSLEAMGSNLCRMFQTLRPEQRFRKRRLLFVNVYYPPQAVGGATRVVHDNVKLLRERYGGAYEIDVICTQEGGSTPYEVTLHTVDGVRVWAITAQHGIDDVEPRDPRMAETFSQLVDRINPDLVHFHCIQRLTASVVDAVRHREIPYLITAHDGWWISPFQFMLDEREDLVIYDYSATRKTDLPERAKLLRRPLFGAERVLAVSESFAELHRRCGVPCVQVLKNGVSTLPSRRRVPSDSGHVRLAHIGGATRHKGIHLVRNALVAGEFSKLELLLVDHSLPQDVVRKEHWGTTPVTVIARIPQSQISELYSRVDVLLAPSIWPESYGLVTREALAAGAWVIASDRGAIGSEVTEGKNGHVIDVSDYTALLEALKEVEANPDRYRKSPASAPQLRSVARQVDELASVYDEILSASGNQKTSVSCEFADLQRLS